MTDGQLAGEPDFPFRTTIMPLRLLEMRLPTARSDEVVDSLDDIPLIERWRAAASDEHQIWHILAHGDQVEAIVDALEEEFSSEQKFRIISFSIEAAIPRPETDRDDEAQGANAHEDAPPAAADTTPASDDEDGRPNAPINIEELYGDVTHGVQVSWNYVTMVATSAIVAAVGIYRDDTILVIAAMIIAPILHPNIALSLATTMADGDLAKEALNVNFLGIVVTVAVAVAFGMIAPFEPTSAHHNLRTAIGILDIAVAASAGIAGALSFTSAKPGGVVGVMVAVALLPPLVSFGMLMGARQWPMAVAPLLLAVINIICINLAAVVTFFIQHIRPRVRYKKEQARQNLRRAVIAWMGLLVALGLISFFSEDYWRSFW